VRGIEDFVAEQQERWGRRGSRDMGTGLLACAPWFTDVTLAEAIATVSKACVVTTKRPRDQDEWTTVRRLRAFNERLAGVPIRAFPELSLMHPAVDGEQVILGPYDNPDSDHWLSTFRTIGQRRTGNTFPPHIHAKLVLLGRFWWHDEHPEGYVDNIIGFRAMRLWVSSANFTIGSRTSLEMGFWTEDAALVDGARRFLLRLIAESEDFDTESDVPAPELAEAELDDEAMAEACAEMHAEREYDDEDGPE
jgi:hypothetical protein